MFKMQRRREKNSLRRENNDFARAASRVFVHSLPSPHDYHVKMPNITFCEGLKQAMTKFSLSLWTWIWLTEIQLQKGSLAFDKVMYRSNRSFNMPPPPGNHPGIWLFWKLLFKFPPTRAKMPFKCPTLGSIQVIKCPHPGDISQAQKWQKNGGNAFSCRTKSL